MVASRTVAVVLHILEGHPWGELVRHDLEEELGARPGLALAFDDPRGRADLQVQFLTRRLREEVSALVVSPADPERLRPVLAQYRDAGIPVVVVDSDVGDPSLYAALVVVDNRSIGRMAGEFLAAQLGDQGLLVEVQGAEGAATARDRSAGFREALAAHRGLEVVETCAGEWREDRARRAFAALLARHPRVDAVFAHNDAMASGAFDAAAALGREDEMLIAGVDALPGERGTIQLVSQGKLAVTYLNPSPGRVAGQAVLSLLDGESCLKKTLLRTSELTSRERLKRWRAARAARARR